MAAIGSTPGDIALAGLEARVYKIPTDRPEADGTFAWDATTMMLVRATSVSGELGIGFSYTSSAAKASSVPRLAAWAPLKRLSSASSIATRRLWTATSASPIAAWSK